MQHLLCCALRTNSLRTIVPDRSRRSGDPLIRFQPPSNFRTKKNLPEFS